MCEISPTHHDPAQVESELSDTNAVEVGRGVKLFPAERVTECILEELALE